MDEDSLPFDDLEIKSTLTAGMGVFTDGYELYSISLVFYYIQDALHLQIVQEGFLIASSYYGAAISAILLGFLSDKMGRKIIYGLDVGLMSIGILSQSISFNFFQLLISRVILGLGIGADYVLSPLIIAENSNPKSRGKRMIITFAVLWGLGAVAAAFVDQILIMLGEPANIVWRIVLLAGIIPAISVFYLRRKIPETYKYLTRIKPIKRELEKLQKELGGNVVIKLDNVPFIKRLKTSIVLILLSTIIWVLYDMYSSTFAIYGPITIAANLGLSPIDFTYAAQFLAGLPGQIISIYLVDKIGRKPLIILGYAGVAFWLFMYSSLLIFPGFFGFNIKISNPLQAAEQLTGEAAVLGFTFYLLNYLFSAIGPASIIGSAMLTPELTPTKIRGTSQAISVATDRLMAALSITAFPLLLSKYGLGALLGVYSIIALLSCIITWFLIPETKGVKLE
ncbi:MFS transporter [Sulfolobus sp. A20]|uniref:MFS transporter n=1 Tax=Saccharolobus sp. A20 TaxID=1891280 RepID=UPI000845BE8E|nr:MFS transporter [Sulfolobus sp. A20]AOL16085.1 MFS transporter [Sulfolobus sp. A20]TRM75521.1 MFS transporter [Sulfolobus sp. A20-N-F8]TRM79306.1 MFS transporter [Sulfolobus sp. B5]TRM88533.1 MFS transporter [Sulfolobus sp. E3]